MCCEWQAKAYETSPSIDIVLCFHVVVLLGFFEGRQGFDRLCDLSKYKCVGKKV